MHTLSVEPIISHARREVGALPQIDPGGTAMQLGKFSLKYSLPYKKYVDKMPLAKISTKFIPWAG